MAVLEEVKNEKVPERLAGRSRSGKQSDKKLELARHALSSLAELGFARVNLREIAARSGVSLGVIHYYFEDKNELLICCVGLYKDGFIQLLDERIASAQTARTLVNQFVGALEQAVAEQSHVHRLWYDVRSQALFDASFAPVVDDLERRMVGVVQRLFDRMQALGGRFDSAGPGDATGAYVAIDGWFRYCLQQHIGGDTRASALLRRRLEQTLRLTDPSRP